MPKIVFTLPGGVTKTVDAPLGKTLLTLAHGNNFPLDGVCGGACACATCRVIVDPADQGRIPAASEDEEYMLDLHGDNTPGSRLGCQIEVTEDLDNLHVTIPDKD